MFSMTTPNEKPILKTMNQTFVVKDKTFQTFQSPKIEVNKIRPATSIGFSLVDVNEKHVNLKGVKQNITYEPETMYKLYGEHMVRPSTTITSSMHNQHLNKQQYLNQREKQKERRFPLDGDYFKVYDQQYKTLLTETQKNFSKNIASREEIKQKCSESKVLTSDRFEKQQNPFIELSSKKALSQKNYHESDIFNQNKKISESKSSEKYTLIAPQPKQYSISSKSNSEWVSLNANPTLLNHASKDYHILNPGIKNIAKTKSVIMNNQSFNPIHRQKMLSEYIDITRVGCPNPNHDFRRIYSSNPFSFNKSKDLCTNMLDNHHKNYKTIVQPPFKR